ncbi:MAG: AEC family transporter [Thermodesulfobacteriota bacterium]|nr:AEC family transporter [Thermodesulfobacteriota bacterium]
MTELFLVFLNVILPVFGIVLLGALLGGRLELQARTLTRAAYYIFVPAFIFQSISQADVPLTSLSRMITFIILTHLFAVLIAAGLGRMLGRSKEIIAAYIMIAAFGNVGNFGLALIQFHLGEIALPEASIYFVVINTLAFVICISAAGWVHGGGRGAVWQVLKTPALWATVPAVMVAMGEFAVPLLLDRMVGLLAGAMIPVMLFALGLQLREQGKIHLTTDVFLASGFRLLLAPLLALLLAVPFGLSQIESAAGVLQAAMPVAILVSIIAKENDIVPDFVTSVVVVSTLASIVTLSLLMVWL